MQDFLAFFLPMLALQLSPVLMPLIGWTVGTLKDAITDSGPRDRRGAERGQGRHGVLDAA